jgi:rubrerythrin
MTYIYTPVITLEIPADIPTDMHPAIVAKIDAARASLTNRNSFSREAALDMAALALSKSGAGACGRPAAARGITHSPEWDLSTIPRELLRAEYAKSIKPPAPRARVELPCVQCAHPLSARERRQPCPKCGARQPRESST